MTYMANAMSILAGKKLAVSDITKSCTIKVDPAAGSNNAEVTIKFIIESTDITVDTPEKLKKMDFARILTAITTGNLSPENKEIRVNVTTENTSIFLNVSVQLDSVKGKHAS